MNRVHIIWNDCYSIDRWMAKELADLETRELMECETIGFVIKRTRKYITICHTFNDEGSVCGVLQIPRKMIVIMEKI